MSEGRKPLTTVSPERNAHPRKTRKELRDERDKARRDLATARARIEELETYIRQMTDSRRVALEENYELTRRVARLEQLLVNETLKRENAERRERRARAAKSQ